MGQDHLDPGITQAVATALSTGPLNVVGQFPLSFMQESLWFMDQVAPGTSAYNLPEGRRLRGRLNLAALQESLDAMVCRHESLRTVLRSEQGQPIQLVLSPAPFALQVRDFVAPQRTETDLETALAAEAARPFDLKRGPLARGTLFRLSPEEHVLLINLHHIICDQWSINLFFSELAQHYTAAICDCSIPTAELPVQYGDFATWQRQTFSGPAFEEHIRYWQQKLNGLLPELALATDHPRPPVPTYRGRTQFFTLPGNLESGLKKLSRRHGATMFMTLLAGFKVFLHRYCRQTELLVGSPFMCRGQEELQRVIGFFVNTHALRTNLDGNPSFIELLGRVRETVLEAEAHQDISADQVMRALRRERDLGPRSLVQVICSLQPPAQSGESWGDLRVDRVEFDNRGAKFDWSLLFTETSQGLQLRCEYSTDLFEHATVTRLIGHFETMLEGIIAQPSRRLSQFPLLTERERARLLSQSHFVQPLARSICLHEWFEERAAAAPEAPAVSFEGESVTYGELNARSNKLARYLKQHQVGPETRVALYLERSLQQVIAMLGVLKAGGAYVPIDPGYPTERLKFILEDTSASVLLTQKNLAKEVAQAGARVICLDADWAEIDRQPCENLQAAAEPSNAAYIIYTSGSTGKPKGVVVTHQNVVRLLAQTESWYSFNAGDVWCLFHSYSFDFSVWELWGALLYGGRLVVVPFLISRSPREFLQLLAKEQVTVLNQTPSAFRQLMWEEARSSPGPLLKLRYVIFGGEALELQSLRPWFERHGDEQPRLINMYGITETTVHVTYRVIRQADLNGRPASLIGVPIPDLKLYLLDEDQQPVPLGVPGEIFVGGAGVARGYLNRPELTSQRFVPDPFESQPGARLYRSGDLARYNYHGELEYLGRVDDQVKIRGFRIELGEIESALNRHAAVRQSVVVVQEAPQGGQRLVAYIVTSRAACPVAELREHLQRTLPEYMIPAAFVFLESLPLTNNGKVDRRALPAPIATATAVAQAVAPRSRTEKLVAETWSELLERPVVHIEDNFFQLGGHSLLATQAISRLSALSGHDLSVRLLFEHPTVAALAEAIGRASESPCASSAIPRRIRKGDAQELLTKLDCLSPAEIDQLLRASEGQSVSA